MPPSFSRSSPDMTKEIPLLWMFRFPITQDRKSTRLNSSHSQISYAVFCLKKKKHPNTVHSLKLFFFHIDSVKSVPAPVFISYNRVYLPRDTCLHALTSCPDPTGTITGHC